MDQRNNTMTKTPASTLRQMLVLNLSVLIVLLDQFTKYLIYSQFQLGDFRTIIPGLFDLHYVRNTGAAFGMMAGHNDALVLLSFVMLIVIAVFRKAIMPDILIYRISMGFVIGGIVGNLLDRMKHHYVVDFLDFYWRDHHFPAFNVADMAICIGVGLYAIAQFTHPLEAPSKPKESATPSDSITPGEAA